MHQMKVLQYKQLINDRASAYGTEINGDAIKTIAHQLFMQTPDDFREITAACFRKLTDYYIHHFKGWIFVNSFNQAPESLKDYTAQLVQQFPNDFKEINYAYLHVKYELIGRPLLPVNYTN